MWTRCSTAVRRWSAVRRLSTSHVRFVLGRINTDNFGDYFRNESSRIAETAEKRYACVEQHRECHHLD